MNFVYIGETRRDDFGTLLLLSISEGCAMVRRPDGIPFLLTLKRWWKLPIVSAGRIEQE